MRWPSRQRSLHVGGRVTAPGTSHAHSKSRWAVVDVDLSINLVMVRNDVSPNFLHRRRYHSCSVATTSDLGADNEARASVLMLGRNEVKREYPLEGFSRNWSAWDQSEFVDGGSRLAAKDLNVN